MSSVAFNVIPSNLRVPGSFAEMDNSQANTAVSAKPSLLIGHKLAAGSAVADIQVLCSSLTMAIQLTGRGSQLARMFKAYKASDPMAMVYLLPVAEPAAGVAATGTITVTGTATESGTLAFMIAGQHVQVGVTSTQAAAAVATAIAAKINALPDLPVTAAAVAGVVTLTARWKGLTGNDIKTILNYYGRANNEVTPAGLAIAIVAMNGGTGSPDLNNAIAAVGDMAFETVVAAWTDTTSLDAIKSEFSDGIGRWSYLRQQYGRCYTALRGLLSALTTFGSARNDQHMTTAGFEPSVPNPSWEYAAAYAARNALFLRNDPARPTQTGELTGILAADKSDRFSIEERQALLWNGIATSYTDDSGTVRVERAITAYRSNVWGQDDNSYLDNETLATSEYVLRAFHTGLWGKYGRCKLADDGTNYASSAAIVTPSVVRGEIIAIYGKLEKKGIVENAALFAKVLVVERNANDPCRLDIMIPPDYVNQLRMLGILNQFRLQFAE